MVDWKYIHFNDFIFNNICETALFEDEHSKLVNEPLSSLRKVAKNLRISNDTGKGSELAEILLYGVMKHHYKALFVVPKSFTSRIVKIKPKGLIVLILYLKTMALSLCGMVSQSSM